MYCKNCGAQLRPGSKFCHKCGCSALLSDEYLSAQTAQSSPVEQPETSSAAPETDDYLNHPGNAAYYDDYPSDSDNSTYYDDYQGDSGNSAYYDSYRKAPKNTARKGNPNRTLTIILSIVLVALVIVIGILAALLFTRSHGKGSGNRDGGPASAFAGGKGPEITEDQGELVEFENGDVIFVADSSHLQVDEDTYERYYDNTLNVFLMEEPEEDRMEELAGLVGGTSCGQMSGALRMMQILVPESGREELLEMAEILTEEEDVLYAVYEFPLDMDDSNLEVSFDRNPFPDPGSKAAETSKGNEAAPDGLDWWAEAIGAYTAWEYADDCMGSIMGVIDSGFNDKHEDMRDEYGNYKGIFLDGFEMNNPDSLHGTHVAGLLNASNNELGIRGVADSSTLICMDWKSWQKTMGKGSIYFLEMTNSLLQAGVHVINNSWEVPTYGRQKYEKVRDANDPDKPMPDTYEKYLRTNKEEKQTGTGMFLIMMIDILNAGYDDFLIVQSAGNGYDGDNLQDGYDCSISGGSCTGITKDFFNDFPVDVLSETDLTYEDVKEHLLVVAAADEPSEDGVYPLADFSNFGETIDIAAPGTRILSCGPENDTPYVEISGTSMACPIVAGSAAYMKSLSPGTPMPKIREYLLTYTQTAVGVSHTDNPSRSTLDPDDTGTVYPMLNLGSAVTHLMGSYNNGTYFVNNHGADYYWKNTAGDFESGGLMDYYQAKDTVNGSLTYVVSGGSEEAFFSGPGFGKLCVWNGRVFFRDKLNVYGSRDDGSDRITYGKGLIQGASDDTGYLYAGVTGDQLIAIDMASGTSYTLQSGGETYYEGTCDERLYYSVCTSSGTSLYKAYKNGDAPELIFTGPSLSSMFGNAPGVGKPVIENLQKLGDYVFFTYGPYGGSAGVYQGGKTYAVNVKTKEVIEVPFDSYAVEGAGPVLYAMTSYSGMPADTPLDTITLHYQYWDSKTYTIGITSYAMEGGTAAPAPFAIARPGQVIVENGSVYAIEDIYGTVTELVSPSDYDAHGTAGLGFFENSHITLVDARKCQDCVYFAIDYFRADPSQDLGWRPYFDRVVTEFYRKDLTTGEVKLIHSY